VYQRDPLVRDAWEFCFKCRKPADYEWAAPFNQELMRADMGSYELEDDIQCIKDYFAPTKDTGPAELDPYAA
jgi:hypothetical protein